MYFYSTRFIAQFNRQPRLPCTVTKSQCWMNTYNIYNVLKCANEVYTTLAQLLQKVADPQHAAIFNYDTRGAEVHKFKAKKKLIIFLKLNIFRSYSFISTAENN